MKRVFIIETQDHLGPMWMNKDNLESCLKSVNHVRSDLVTDIVDVTDRYEKFMKILKWCATKDNGTQKS